MVFPSLEDFIFKHVYVVGIVEIAQLKNYVQKYEKCVSCSNLLKIFALK